MGGERHDSSVQYGQGCYARVFIIHEARSKTRYGRDDSLKTFCAPVITPSTARTSSAVTRLPGPEAFT
jgi:hypothetical protein